MKNTKKLISVVLAAMLVITAIVSVGITASAATDTLASYYATNPDGKVGVQKTITVDGSISDWDSSMLIAQGTANDDPRVYRPDSMYEKPIDLYALYGAYDDNNLYLMWEMTNVQDIVAPNDNYPLSQGILYQTENVPFFIAIDTGKSDDAIGNNAKLQSGGTLWDSGITFEKSFNRMIAVSTNGSNGPFIYSGNASGINAKEIYNSSTAGITFKYGLGIISKNIYGIDKAYGTYNNRVPGDMCNESSAWVDFLAKGHKTSTMDFHYEMSIPLSKLGITKSDITSNGIGAMVVATFGKSGMDSLPYDLSMNDNADLDDAGNSQEQNSREKSDEDFITASFARIGAQGENPVQPTTQQEQPTTQQEQPTNPPVTNTLTVNATSNYFNTSTASDLKVGDTVTVKYEMTSNMKVASAQWNLAYDSSKLKLKTPANSLCPSGGTINENGNPILGNFTDADNLFDFTLGKTFVQAEFEVLGTGSTNVSLTLQELNLGYHDSNGALHMASIVEDSQIKNITGQAGFSNAKVTASSETTNGSAIDDSLTVHATSNFFETDSATFDASTNKVTVSYMLKSSMSLVNAQWVLTYDSSKLSVDKASMPKVNNASITLKDGLIVGSFTDLGLVDFSDLDDFVTVTFNAIGTGDTTVNLQLDYLGVGYHTGNDVVEAYPVDDGVVQNITRQAGFSGYYNSTLSLVYDGTPDFLRGDVDMNGVITINDVTELQRYLSEFITLNSTQMLAADANADGRVDVRDVTAIQRYLVGLFTIPD